MLHEGCFHPLEVEAMSSNIQVQDLDEETKLLTLQRGPFRVCITNWGATVTSLFVPNFKGDVADIVLGFDSLKPYQDGTSPYFGCVVGRVANRIAGATFALKGERYNLIANEGSNTLHGGKAGFDKVLWKVAEVKPGDNPSVRFTYHSVDGEQGFPGDLDVSVTYTLSGDYELRMEMIAIPTQKATPVSLTSHTYWNLAGHDSGDVLDHVIQIWASHMTPVDETLIPTGEFLPVEATPFDFRDGASIGSRINEIPGGYDHNFVLDQSPKLEGELHIAARVKDPKSCRVMDVFTNAPGMQFYSGNFLTYVEGKGGAIYKKHGGLCLETQGFPNAVNEPKFPSVIVEAGQIYKHVVVNKFYTES